MPEINLDKVRDEAKKKKLEFCVVELKTDRQEGDIAGTKMLKFYEHLKEETEKVFEIKNFGFSYDGKQSASIFFVANPKKEIVFHGPNINQKENVKSFKKMHKKIIVQKGRLIAKEKINFTIHQFLEKWKTRYSMKVLEMDINEMNVLN